MFIDIHSHQPASESANLCFLVGKHSLGIHPWELTLEHSRESVEKRFRELQGRLSHEVLAIGECGLDRARDHLWPMEQQLEVLEWHMNWAISAGRPLILHCVRAHSDLLMLLKKKRYSGKILLHDYAGNLDEAMKLMNYDAFFSFGASLFGQNSRTPQVLKTLPLERIFLETDDQREYGIEAIYHKASEVMKLTLPQLEKQLEKNLLVFFGDLHDIRPTDLINYLR